MEAETPCIGWALALYTNIILIKGFSLISQVKLLEAGKFEYNLEDLVEW